MSTNDGKENQKPSGKPAVTRKVKGERQKAKGESANQQVESARPKAESTKPKAISAENKPKVKPKPEDRPAETLPTANSQLQTDTTMEVHHHPQLDHGPKPIKEYLLEGFMIFIAVMMGFIAENIREGIDNNEQVGQLTAQLVQDMKTDTAKLHGIYSQETLILKSNDTLFNLLEQPLATVNTREIQRLAIASHSMWPFHPSGGAIGAIKNELHLKQFSNSKIIDLIAKYEEHIELTRTVQDITLQYQHTYLDAFLLQHFTPGNLAAAFNRAPIPNGQMRNLTQNDLTLLAADMALIRINTEELLRDNQRLKADAIALLEYAKKQFHPDE